MSTPQEPLSPVKQALITLREMRSELDGLRYRQHEPIAIVGAGLRFPGGAGDLGSFWRLLLEGFDGIREVPPERWSLESFYDPDPDAPGRMYSRHGGFLDGIDCFDPAFFGISPREAASMDPQQRVLLEVGYEAIENAGLSPEALSESTIGIFLGISNSDYLRMLLRSVNGIDAYTTTGSASSIAASRLAYFLNLKGPTMAVDTACSSSLVAMHLAVGSLRSGECEAALVGGVNLILTPELTINFCKARMLSPEGRCKTFDRGADGYVRGEGCAVVVLKRLSDARADGDNILAVIRGSALNQDGRSGGITAPNGPSQEEVILAALKDAAVKPEEVGYVEAHGTATPLGDPIEARALGAVLGRNRPKDGRLVIGSVKTNIGHLEAAAGIAGLIKAALALKHGMIPAHLHLKEVNPHIPLDELGLAIPHETMPWPKGETKRIAGVSSFGLSGTNAHMVLEAPDHVPVSGDEDGRSLRVLTISARGGKELEESARRFVSHLEVHPNESFRDVCFTAATGRAHLNHRLAVLAGTGKEAADGLREFLQGREGGGIFHGAAGEGSPPARVAFLFTGQGAQYPGMGRRLFETEPLFRQTLEECDELLRPHMDRRLLDVLYPQTESDKVLLDNTVYTQPAIFCLEYALAKLWQSWGVKPGAVMGHSLGEYAAACVAGVFGLEDGVELVARRAALTGSFMNNGKMVAIFADEERAARAIEPFRERLFLAALNGPANTVVSGEGQAMEGLIAVLEAEGVGWRPLNVSTAFHSSLMEPAVKPFGEVAAGVAFSKPRITLISNLTAKPVTAEEMCGPGYWLRHLREPVRFSESIATLASLGYTAFIEIGPAPVLAGMAKPLVSDAQASWLPSLRKGADAEAQMLDSLSALYASGGSVDWAGYNQGRKGRRVALPTYPFRKDRYWAEESRETTPHNAEDLPTLWSFVLDSALRQADQGPLDLNIEGYPAKWLALERLTIAYISKALVEIGAFREKDESLSVDEFMERFPVSPSYRKLISRWFNRLTEAGILVFEEGLFAAVSPLASSSVDLPLEETREAFGGGDYLMDYVERCGDMCMGVLTGKTDPLETLFPDGSSAQAERLYGEWPVSRQISAVAATVVQTLASAYSGSGTFRILEIGAGTGGTTGAVLGALPPRPSEYLFTDVSEFFFARAREKYGVYPFVSYGLLDIEKDPAAQGYPSGAFHVVLATNVFHATLDLESVVDHALALLAPHGVLVLSEITEDFAWLDITTGLIEGWQRFGDTWRKESPLLFPQKWKEILKARGFEEVEAVPRAGSVSEVLGQHVIIARAPGGKGAVSTGPADRAVRLRSEPEERKAGSAGLDTPPSHLPEAALKVLESPADERLEALVDFVSVQIAAVLRMGSRNVPRRSRLMDMGLDSLMAVELRDRLTRALGLPERLPATLIFDYPTPESIASFLEGELTRAGIWSKDAEKVHEKRETPEAAAAHDIASLSDEQVERMIMEKLKKKREGTDA